MRAPLSLRLETENNSHNQANKILLMALEEKIQKKIGTHTKSKKKCHEVARKIFKTKRASQMVSARARQRGREIHGNHHPGRGEKQSCAECSYAELVAVVGGGANS